MLLPLFLMSCLNKDNNIVSLLKEWEQKEILFPKEMYFTTMLRDTTYYNLQSEYKILAYVDSIGCTSCKLQLSAWSMLINEIDSLYAGRVKFIFAFSPNRIKDIYHAILTANFTYPVYVDKQDSIDFIERQPVFHLARVPPEHRLAVFQKESDSSPVRPSVVFFGKRKGSFVVRQCHHRRDTVFFQLVKHAVVERKSFLVRLSVVSVRVYPAPRNR